jgi:hypothetical protein
VSCDSLAANDDRTKERDRTAEIKGARIVDIAVFDCSLLFQLKSFVLKVLYCVESFQSF